MISTWKPKLGQVYWYWSGKVHPIAFYDVFYGNKQDMQRCSIGNCFPTREDCESCTEILDKLLLIKGEPNEN